MSLLPFFEDSLWGHRRGWDWMDLDPWSSRSPMISLDRLCRELDSVRGRLNENMRIDANNDNYQVALDVRGYKPDELQVCVEDGRLTMTGKHEERSQDGNHFVSRQFTRSFTLPEAVDAEKIKSSLCSDGRTLKIEAPVKRPAIEESDKPREIPIQIQYKKPIEHKRIGCKA